MKINVCQKHESGTQRGEFKELGGSILACLTAPMHISVLPLRLVDGNIETASCPLPIGDANIHSISC